MSDMISTPPAPASPVNSTVGADGWFSDIDVNAIRDTIRMGEGIVTHARLVAAIEGAMLTAMRQPALRDWRTAQIALGHDDLASVEPDLMVNGRTRPEVIWERIIRYYAAAELAEINRDLIATDQATIRADNERMTADDYRRLGHDALADLINIGAAQSVARNAVELI